MKLDTNMLRNVINAVAESYPDVRVAPFGYDGVPVVRLAERDAWEIRLKLVPTYYYIEVDHRAAQLLGAKGIVDLLHDRFTHASPALRGCMLVDWLDSKKVIDMFHDAPEPEHERAERLALHFTELAETMMMRAKRGGA